MTEMARHCPWVNADDVWPIVGEWFIALGRDSRGHPSVSILVRLGDAFYRCPNGGINRDLVRETERVRWWTYGPEPVTQIPHREALQDELCRARNRIAEIESELQSFGAGYDSPPILKPPPEEPLR